MVRVADYVIQRVVDEGVKHIFLITGRGILYLSDAVAKNEEITPISVHHEQAAAYAAVAYSQYNDKLGAALVSTGCASTNALTGVLNAWQDGVPVIFISGQNKMRETVAYTGKNIRTWGSQEANVIPIVKPITKYANIITDASKIGEEMDKAIYYATHGVKGPAWLDIPVDVQNARVEPEQLSRWNGDESVKEASTADVNFVTRLLNEAKRPVFLIGSGIRASHGIEQFKELVEKTKVPVCFSASAVDSYGISHELSMGTVGTIGGTRAGNFAVQNADLIISIGCRLSPMLTDSQYQKFARAAKLIVVDIDENEHSKDTVRIDKLILSDAKFFIDALIKKNLSESSKEWQDKCKHWKQVFPKCEDSFRSKDKIDLYDFADQLTKHLKDDAVILTDAGLEEVIVPTVVGFKDGQRCLHPASQGCMGVALPASMGAYYSCGHDVVAVIGDGSVMMNLQEMQTISANKMGIKIIIINNKIYSVIRTRQVELFRNRTIGTNPENGVTTPDFKDVAQCFKIPYVKINDISEFDSKVDEVMNLDGPVICEVMAVEDQVYIRNGAGFNSQRKFVMRPLEDQMPFLDREIIKNEMIVEPIDL
jgi:acetolactate synthase-1/2/3 large subunit